MFGRRVRTRIEHVIKAGLLRITSSPLLGFTVPFIPYQSHRNAYMIPLPSPRPPSADPARLPVPPQSLWLGYGASAEVYVGSGQRHVEPMKQHLAATGWALQPGGRVLDFGCGAGRMIRWFAADAATCEIWGTDISAAHITWCQQNLSPPFHFVTTTTMPHLPFEDRSFDLIYAGSVFSHLDDLADAWLLELRRVARPGGRLFLTIMDQTSIASFRRPDLRDFWLRWYLPAHPEYRRFIGAPFAKFTIGRAMQAQVFYERAALAAKLARWFRVHAVIPEAHGFQTALILEKPAEQLH